MPPTNPWAVKPQVVGLAIVVHDPLALGARCTRYRSIFAPPLLAGADQASLTTALPRVAVGDRGGVAIAAVTSVSLVLTACIGTALSAWASPAAASEVATASTTRARLGQFLNFMVCSFEWVGTRR